MKIICVHQGYELYGSDRCFVESVAAIRAGWPTAEIEVVLAHDGEIVTPLRKYASRIVIEPIFVLRRRGIAKLLLSAPFRFPLALWRAMRRFSTADLVYVNTIVVLDYLLVARFFSRKTIVHVHEIPDGAISGIFRLLLRWSHAELIFNSEATRAAFKLSKRYRQHVVYNGFPAPPAAPLIPYDGERPLHLLMIGRISRNKGQDVLIEALASLPRSMLGRIKVRIVGESFANDTAREAALHTSAQIAGLESVVSFEPFCDDPAPLYRWADVVAVPSRFTESLGRVAIEAMAHGRPPLVSALGGLVEVVEDGVTGWVVPASDPIALARKIVDIIRHPESWSGFPAAARARFAEMFEGGRIARQIQAVVGAHLVAGEVERRGNIQPLTHGRTKINLGS